MGEIVGLGMTHFPPLAGRDEAMARILRRALEDPALPERYRQLSRSKIPSAPYWRSA